MHILFLIGLLISTSIFENYAMLESQHGLMRSGFKKQKSDFELPPPPTFKLPSMETIKRRLHRVYLAKFAEDTQLHGILGNKELNVYKVWEIINEAINAYAPPTRNPRGHFALSMRAANIAKSFLKDNPAAIESLREYLLEKDVPGADEI